METPWGELSVSDAHAHLFSRGLFEALHKQTVQAGSERTLEHMVQDLGWELPADNSSLADQWSTELDQHGVKSSVLMSSVPGDEGSAAEVVRAKNDRLHGYFMFNPLAPNPEGRAKRAFDEMGLRGLCLFPAMFGFSVQDERLAPLYQLSAERPGTVVFVHMGVLTVGVRKKLGLASRFDMSRSNPIDLHRVALEHPNVNFVVPHFGAGYFRETLMLGDLVPNVYVDTSSSNSWVKYMTPSIDLKNVFAKTLQIYGHERILFGSDSSFFPRGWNRPVFESQVAVLQELGVETQEAAAILGGNLRSLLGR